MEYSRIEWTHHTFNPIIGCTKVSPACANCYAERDMAHNRNIAKWGKDGNRILTNNENWKSPLKWDKIARANNTRCRVFCASLSDVFEDWQGPIKFQNGSVVSKRFDEADNSDLHNDDLATMDDVRTRLFQLIDLTTHLDWLLLTKRPENIQRMLPDNNYRSNVWLGTSVENDHYLHRIDHLKSCKSLAAKLFISAEPLLGPISTLGDHLDEIDWVIAGGESGPSARPSHPEWFKSIRDQCELHNVVFHFKQWGEWSPSYDGDYDVPQYNWQDGVVSFNIGKRNAGRLLYGVLYNGTPE